MNLLAAVQMLLNYSLKRFFPFGHEAGVRHLDGQKLIGLGYSMLILPLIIANTASPRFSGITGINNMVCADLTFGREDRPIAAIRGGQLQSRRPKHPGRRKADI